MQISNADSADISKIIHQVYPLWSGGLAKGDYIHFFENYYHQVWTMRNIRRSVYKEKGEVIVSAKLVSLPFFKNGRYYRILGLGALFTLESHRNVGLANSFVKTIIKQAKAEKMDGVLLHSAIDMEFYEKLGLRSLGNLDFVINPKIYSANDSLISQSFNLDQNIFIETRQISAKLNLNQNTPTAFIAYDSYFSENELLEILRCYERWMVKQPYGIARDPNYFLFYLTRFIYFANRNQNNKSSWFLTIAKGFKNRIIGYAITECSGTSMRIIDLIGDNAARALLWKKLIEEANLQHFERISGFESLIRDFIPNNRLDTDLFGLKPQIRPGHIQCDERMWSSPMFLPLNPDLRDLFSYNPCPLLEFDYF